MSVQHGTAQSFFDSQYATVSSLAGPFSPPPYPAVGYSPFPGQLVGADAFPLSPAPPLDLNPGLPTLDDRAAAGQPTVVPFSPLPFPSSSSSPCPFSSSRSLAFPHSSAPSSSAYQALPYWPSVADLIRPSSPVPQCSAAPAVLPLPDGRSPCGGPPLWQCSLGCGQRYARSSGRSIRKHFAACFRSCWPGGDQLTENALEALISAQQSRGVLDTGLRSWKMRCSSTVRPVPRGGRRRHSATEERSFNADGSRGGDDDRDQDQHVKLQQVSRSATAMSESGRSSTGGGSSCSRVRSPSSHRALDAPAHAQQPLPWGGHDDPSAVSNDGFASATGTDAYANHLFFLSTTGQRVDGDDGRGGGQSAQQVIISRIQHERCSLLQNQAERRERQESEHLRERQRLESFHTRLLLSDIYADHCKTIADA